MVGASAAATAELRGCLPRWGVWNVSSTPPPFLFCIGPARRRRHTPPSYPDLHRRSISSRSSPLLEGGTLRFVESAAPLLLLLRAEREKQLLSPSPSIQITPPSLSPLLCLSSLSPFRFLELLLFFFLFVLVVAQPRLGHFHRGNEDRAEEIFDFQRSSRSSLHARKLEIARSLLLSGLLEIAGG